LFIARREKKKPGAVVFRRPGFSLGE